MWIEARDGGEEVVAALVVPIAMARKVLEAVEETFDEIAVAVEEGAEGGALLAVIHAPDIGPGAAGRHFDAQCIGVVRRGRAGCRPRPRSPACLPDCARHAPARRSA